MSKLDELRRTAGQHVKDSTGGDRNASPTPGSSGPPARWKGVVRSRDAAAIPLEMIVPDPDQPRTEFDEQDLGRLADSLRIRGQLQPCRVRWDEGRGAYMILVGERRMRAARMAGLATLDCVIVERPIASDELLALQLVENALREDLKPVEQARAFRRLIDAKGWSTRELATELHVAQSSVVRALALLELPAEVQEQVEQGALGPTLAYEVAKLERPEDQVAVAQAAVDQGLRRSEVAELAQAVRARRPAAQTASRPDPLSLDLGDVMVTVRWKKGGSTTSALQALRRAIKEVQEQGRSAEDHAA
jgi:ParB family chromosome partitioning protein